MPSLVDLLRDANAAVRTAAAGALMSLAADVACKKAAVDAKAVAALAPMLEQGLALELRGAMDETTSKMTVRRRLRPRPRSPRAHPLRHRRTH